MYKPPPAYKKPPPMRQPKQKVAKVPFKQKKKQKVLEEIVKETPSDDTTSS